MQWLLIKSDRGWSRNCIPMPIYDTLVGWIKKYTSHQCNDANFMSIGYDQPDVVYKLL